jgi:hypothetical protein
MIDCRVDSIDETTFALLKRSGLKKVFVGVESASPFALASYKKGYRTEIIREKLGILEDLNIDFILGYIFFSPLDTLEGLERSLQLVETLDVRDFNLFLQSVRVYPGTPLYFDLARRGLLEGDFPFFSAIYPNPVVERIRQIMTNFGELAWLAHPSFESDGKRAAKLTREAIYELAVRLLHGLFNYGQRQDMIGMDRLFSEIKGELVI